MAGLANIQLSNKPDFGLREDGTSKGTGYFGVLPMQDGSKDVATEMSTQFNYDGKEVLVPLINPLLTQEELTHLLKGKPPTKNIIDKAGQFGLERLKQGRSPFVDDKDTQQQGLINYKGKQ